MSFKKSIYFQKKFSILASSFVSLMPSKPTYIDLFAGCGGLSLGLYKAGWKGVFAIEKSPDAFKTLEYNLINKHDHFAWPCWLPKKSNDIKIVLERYRKQLIELRGRVDMVTGGPPCQGFSTAGKRNENDHRNDLINDYIEFIHLIRPKILFFENVKGFTLGFDKNKDKGKQYSTYVTQKLEKLGYRVAGSMINFSEYGVPQKRCRFILVGIRNDVAKSKNSTADQFFDRLTSNREQFLVSKDLKLTVNLEDAISDLLRQHGEGISPDTNSFKAGKYSSATSAYQRFMRERKRKGTIADSHRFVKHRENIEQRFKLILKQCTRNKDVTNEFKQLYQLKKHTIVPLASDEPAPTLTTLPDDYIHYIEPRILTVREYARIQSFPDSYVFKGKYTTGGKSRTKEAPRYTQIGNAIPPLFGEQAGIILNMMISG